MSRTPRDVLPPWQLLGSSVALPRFFNALLRRRVEAGDTKLPAWREGLCGPAESEFAATVPMEYPGREDVVDVPVPMETPPEATSQGAQGAERDRRGARRVRGWGVPKECVHLSIVEQTLSCGFGHLGLVPDAVLRSALGEFGQASRSQGTGGLEELRRDIALVLARRDFEALLSGSRPGR